MKNYIQFLTLILFASLVSACATNKLSLQERRLAYDKFIETEQLPEVDRIKSFHFDRWSSLGDQHLILYRRINEPYLIKLKYKCHNLDFAMNIGVRSFGNTLAAKTDYVMVPDNIPIKCFIGSIYKLTKEQKNQMFALGKAEEQQVSEKEKPVS